MESSVVRRALWFSFFDGIATVCMVGLLETHGIAALLSLHATDMELALMGSVPLFLSALIQLAAPWVSAHVHARKPVCLVSVGGQILMLLLLGLCGWFKASWITFVFVALYSLYAMSGSFGSSMWSSWIADLVPPQVRGRMFAWRNRSFCVAQVSVGVLSGIVVKHCLGLDLGWRVFMGVFIAAALFRTIALACLARQYEPPLAFRHPRRDFTYLDFLRKASTSNFARFTIFVALIHGGTAVAGPFFTKYYLDTLHLRYDVFTLVVNAHLVGTLLFLPFWGKIADHYGNWLVVRLTAAIIALLPLPYLFLTQPSMLMLLNFTAGASWSGFGLATFSYLLDSVTPQRRVRCAAYMGATVGFSIFACGLCGGWLAHHLPPILFWKSGYQTLFAVSSIARCTVVGVFVGFGLVREIRHVKRVTPAQIFSELPGVRLSLDFARNAYRVFRRV